MTFAKNLSLVSLGVLALSIGGARASLAADAPEGACHEKIEKLCPGLKPGDGLGKCIAEKKSELPTECQEKIANHQEKRKEHKERLQKIEEACKADLPQCPGMKPGHGLLKCLMEKPEVSTGCKNTIQETHKDLKAEQQKK